MPVLGFNSGKYDLNAVKEFLLPYLVKNEGVKFTIKRNNNHMCLKTEHLKFLDITNYLAPGFSYAQFLKAYECPAAKGKYQDYYTLTMFEIFANYLSSYTLGFFPYEWMDSLDKLEHPALPPHQAFYSSLTNKNISVEEYQYCQRVWDEQGMQTFRDFLIWYNDLDVEPFVEAVKKMMDFWRERQIDMFKDGVSVPGLTMKYLFSFPDEQTYFSLFSDRNKDLYDLFKDNNTGGPSIIFHRYHEAGKTKIREVDMMKKGLEPKTCQKVLGYDANALYLWAIMQDMPTGSYTRRRAETHFKPEHSRRMADEWIAWEARQRGIKIRHQLNNTEKRIGARRLPVDGFHSESQTVFQFHGK